MFYWEFGSESFNLELHFATIGGIPRLTLSKQQLLFGVRFWG